MSQISQNIFDNDEFFECYRNLRAREDNCNVLIEQPAMKTLLPDLKGKTVLDLGCGYGGNCRDFISRGAAYVKGIDLSEKMLQVANKTNNNINIEYLRIDMNDIASLREKYDFLYSSLAFHYVEDFNRLIANIYSLLNKDGILLFSQEHPIITATITGGYFNRDENGNKVSYTFSDYMLSGIRCQRWFVDNVIKYHRPVSHVVNALAENGFIIENMTEPVPSAQALEVCPAMIKEFKKPNFLIVKARKQ